MAGIQPSNAFGQGLNPALSQGAPTSGALNNVPPVTGPVQPQVPVQPTTSDFAGSTVPAAAHASAMDAPPPAPTPADYQSRRSDRLGHNVFGGAGGSRSLSRSTHWPIADIRLGHPATHPDDFGAHCSLQSMRRSRPYLQLPHQLPPLSAHRPERADSRSRSLVSRPLVRSRTPLRPASASKPSPRRGEEPPPARPPRRPPLKHACSDWSTPSHAKSRVSDGPPESSQMAPRSWSPTSQAAGSPRRSPSRPSSLCLSRANVAATSKHYSARSAPRRVTRRCTTWRSRRMTWNPSQLRRAHGRCRPSKSSAGNSVKPPTGETDCRRWRIPSPKRPRPVPA